MDKFWSLDGGNTARNKYWNGIIRRDLFVDAANNFPSRMTEQYYDTKYSFLF